MYKFKVYIYLNRVPFCARQKSYGFKNLVKLGGWGNQFQNLTRYACTYDCTEIYRRSHAGYACTYDYSNIYREDDEDDDDDEGKKIFFKIAQNLIFYS